MSSEKYIGLDVHQAMVSVTVMDSQGKVVMESILKTKASTHLESLAGLHVPANLWRSVIATVLPAPANRAARDVRLARSDNDCVEVRNMRGGDCSIHHCSDQPSFH